MDEAIRIPLERAAGQPRRTSPRSNSWPRSCPTSATPPASSRSSQRLVKEAPKSAWSHYYAASLFFLQSRHDLALQAARNAVAIDPAHAKAHNLIGACLAIMGQPRRGAHGLRGLAQGRPARAGHLHQPRDLELQAGNRDLRDRYFAEALTVDPTSQSARDGLASINR